MLAEQPELEHGCSQIASFHVHIYHVLTHIETCCAYLLIELLQLRVTLDVVGDCARAAAEHLAGLGASTAGRNQHLCNLFHRKIGLLDGWLIFLASLHFGEFWAFSAGILVHACLFPLRGAIGVKSNQPQRCHLRAKANLIV